MNSKNIVVGAVILGVSLIFGFIGGGLSGGNKTLGGLYNTNPSHNYGGLYAGDGDEFTVAADGTVTVTGTLSATTFAGIVSGTTGLFTGYLDSNAGFVEGGQLTVSTTSAARTLTAAEMKAAKVISIADTAGSAVLALTLPATSTMSALLPNAGDSQSWVIDNLHSDAATTTTITAGTGVDIDGTTANDDVLNGGVSGRLQCWRLVNTDVRCIVEEMVDAG